MKIKFFDHELLSKSEADVREIHYAFTFIDIHGEEREGFANIIVSGSLVSSWAFHFKSNNPLEFERELVFFGVKVIENDIIQLAKSGSLTEPVTFKYLTSNAPSINFEYDHFENVDGYEIEYSI